jgi:hypothetical protein
MTARIFKPAKSAMQSGRGKSQDWILEYEPEAPREIDPLMGWTSSGDMRQQVKLTFEAREEAVAYAERNGIPYEIVEPSERRVVPKSYSDNFKFGRIGSWTH